MTSPRGKLTALVCHPTKKVNKAEELTYLSTNIGQTRPHLAGALVTREERFYDTDARQGNGGTSQKV